MDVIEAAVEEFPIPRLQAVAAAGATVAVGPREGDDPKEGCPTYT